MLIFLAVVLVFKVIVDWFLSTDIGLAIQATGNNEQMIRSFGVNTDGMKILTLSISNGLVGLAGALIAQFNGVADISMGIGVILVGLASVILGQAVLGQRWIWLATLAVIVGAVLYRLIIFGALRIGFNQNDMKLITALLVIAALLLALGLSQTDPVAAKPRQPAAGAATPRALRRRRGLNRARIDGIKDLLPRHRQRARASSTWILQLAKGDFVTVIGSNGAGKSTLLNAVSGRPDRLGRDQHRRHGRDPELKEHRRARYVGECSRIRWPAQPPTSRSSRTSPSPFSAAADVGSARNHEDPPRALPRGAGVA